MSLQEKIKQFPLTPGIYLMRLVVKLNATIKNK